MTIMKISVSCSDLQEWEACEEGLEEFYAAHGNKTVSLSDALESNSVNDCL